MLLRAAPLPGAELVLPFLVPRCAGGLGWAGTRLGLRPSQDGGDLARGFLSLADASARAAFPHTLRAVIDPGGQRVSGSDRLYLAESLPTLPVWGARDPIIPAAHGVAARVAAREPAPALRRRRPLPALR
jgi:pimeloyl-ACP methyl ester carboxylesterase